LSAWVTEVENAVANIDFIISGVMWDVECMAPLVYCRTLKRGREAPAVTLFETLQSLLETAGGCPGSDHPKMIGCPGSGFSDMGEHDPQRSGPLSASLSRRVNEFVALASWPAVAWVSRPTPDTVCSVTVCANSMDERGFALAARTPPVQPTRRSALQSVDLAVRNAA
jgi:hypothetical protein